MSKKIINNKGGTLAETPPEVLKKANSIKHFKDVKIEIIGSWLWVTGKTVNYSKELKDLNFFMLQKKRFGIIG